MSRVGNLWRGRTRTFRARRFARAAHLCGRRTRRAPPACSLYCVRVVVVNLDDGATRVRHWRRALSGVRRVYDYRGDPLYLQRSLQEPVKIRCHDDAYVALRAEPRDCPVRRSKFFPPFLTARLVGLEVALAPIQASETSHFHGICRQNIEPTSGLKPHSSSHYE